jgi:predicted alpha/beta superfamily hydrolase
VLKLLFGLAMLVASSSTALSRANQDKIQSISIGQTVTIVSRPMHEERVVNVVLPASYAREPGKRYPVLYLIDGGIDQDLLHVAGTAHLGAIWGRSAEAIVVGIETRDRRRELVGPTKDPELLKKYPSAGASKAFRDFIRKEVKPLVQHRYRSNGQDAVLGESLAGLFILETYLNEPDLFGAFAAVDPSLWWDNESLSLSIEARIRDAKIRPPLYIAAAKEQLDSPGALMRVSGALNGMRSRWCLSSRPELLHATIYQQVMPQALQYLLPPSKPAPAEFGFHLQCTQEGSNP